INMCSETIRLKHRKVSRIFLQPFPPRITFSMSSEQLKQNDEELRPDAPTASSSEPNECDVKTVTVVDKTVTVVDKKVTVKDKTATVEDKTATVKDKTATVKDKTATVEDKAATAEDKTATAEDKTATVEDKTATVVDKTATVEDKTATAEDKKATVVDKTATAEDKTATAEDKTATVEDKTATVEDKTATVEDKAVNIEDKTVNVEDETFNANDAKKAEDSVKKAEVEKDKTEVTENTMEAESTSKEAEVADQEAEVADQEAEFAGQEAEFAGQEAEVADQEAEVADQEEEVADQEAEVADQEAEVADQEAEEEEVTSNEPKVEAIGNAIDCLIEQAATDSEQLITAIESMDAVLDEAHFHTIHYETNVVGVVEVTIHTSIALGEESGSATIEEDDFTAGEDRDGTDTTEADEDTDDEEEVDVAGDEPGLAEEDLRAGELENETDEQEDAINAAQQADAVNEGTENSGIIDSNDDDDDLDDDDDDDDDVEDSSSELELTIHGSPAVAAIDVAAAAARLASPAFPPWTTATRNRLSAQSAAAGLATPLGSGSRRGNWHYQLFRRGARFLQRRLRRHSTENASPAASSSPAAVASLRRQKPAVFSRIDERNSISVESGISAMAVDQLNQQRLRRKSSPTAMATKPCRRCSIIVHLPAEMFDQRLQAECNLAADTAAAAAAAAAAKAASANSRRSVTWAVLRCRK
ncbi:hypothetical protein BOX15_Mlig001342g6, partial [Macrostomum lignano]